MPLNARTRTRGRRPAQGYALLEALIAVLVTAIGFIGASRLQTYGLAMNNSGQARQKATLLASQMADRVRANKAGFSAGEYNNPAAGALTCLSAAAGCTPAQLAVADYSEWLHDVQAQLKNGTGTVCVDSTPDTAACDGVGSALAIKLGWDDRGGASSLVTTIRP